MSQITSMRKWQFHTTWPVCVMSSGNYYLHSTVDSTDMLWTSFCFTLHHSNWLLRVREGYAWSGVNINSLVCIYFAPVSSYVCGVGETDLLLLSGSFVPSMWILSGKHGVDCFSTWEVSLVWISFKPHYKVYFLVYGLFSIWFISLWLIWTQITSVYKKCASCIYLFTLQIYIFPVGMYMYFYLLWVLYLLRTLLRHMCC